MALGVLNNLSAIYAENNLNNTNNSLQTVLQQLSSGSRINSGADDAAGLSLINGLAANSAALTQSTTNATEGVGLLQVADGALSQVTSLLNRAITLATEASNGTLDSAPSATWSSPTPSVALVVDCVSAAELAARPFISERPAASSAPELMRDPDDNCCSTVCRLLFVLFRLFSA